MTELSRGAPEGHARHRPARCTFALNRFGNEKDHTVGGLDELDGQKYLSMETYRRTGAAVRTPVWFAAAPAADGDPRLYVYSSADSGKAKRIRRSGAVRIAPCDMRGTVTGSWVEGQAKLVTGEEFDRGMRQINRKYWPWKGMLDLYMRLRPADRRVVIVIRAA
jgi:uncharacterized protein